MGMLDFIWNASQDGTIEELEEKVVKLSEEISQQSKDIETLKQWVEYLNEELKRNGTP